MLYAHASLRSVNRPTAQFCSCSTRRAVLCHAVLYGMVVSSGTAQYGTPRHGTCSHGHVCVLCHAVLCQNRDELPL